jgi:hypothetical protein
MLISATTTPTRYRLSFGLGRRRWSHVPNAAVEEQEGTVQWVAPNDVRVDILGRRQQARSRELGLTSNFDQPWFIPRALGDSIRVFGNEVPRQAALHPLAAEGPSWYHYRLTDSVQMSTREGSGLLLTVECCPPGSASRWWRAVWLTRRTPIWCASPSASGHPPGSRPMKTPRRLGPARGSIASRTGS